MSEYSDQEIINGLKNRQNNVIDYLYKNYLPQISHLIYKFGGNKEDAKDVFQDAILILLEKIDKNELVLNCMLKTFLYCICKYRWKDTIYKRLAASNYLDRLDEPSYNEDFSEIYDDEKFEDMFHKMIETLTPARKKILGLTMQNQSLNEIAVNSGYTYNYLKKKKCICQQDFIRKLDNYPSLKSMIRSRRILLIPIPDLRKD